jgi:hypothetical protein
MPDPNSYQQEEMQRAKVAAEIIKEFMEQMHRKQNSS